MLSQEHPDSSVRYRLALLLGSHADHVVPVLSSAISDPRKRMRRAATSALMQMAAQSATVEALSNETVNKRNRKELPAIAAAVPALTRALRDQDTGVRKAAARTLESLGVHAAEAVPALKDSLQDGSADVRAAAATALGQVGFAAQIAAEALIRASDDPVERVRVAVIVAIARLGHLVPSLQSFVPVLLTRLEDISAEVRSAAASAFGQLGVAFSSPVVVEALIKTLADAQSHVRTSAARSLGQVGAHKAANAVPSLIQCMKDEDIQVRKAAATSLGRLGNVAVSANSILAEALRDPSNVVREAAAAALSRLGERDKLARNICIAALIRGCNDPNVEVRVVVTESLADLARWMPLGTYEDDVEQAMNGRRRDEDPRIRNNAATCAKIISMRKEAERKKKDECASDDEEF